MRKLFTVMFLVLAVFIMSCTADNGGNTDGGGGGDNTGVEGLEAITDYTEKYVNAVEWSKGAIYDGSKPKLYSRW